MSRTAKAAGLVLIGGIIWGMWWLWSSMPDLWPEVSPDAPAISTEGARIAHYDAQGQKLWELEARLIKVQEEFSVADEVTVHFFDNARHETLTVQAPHARLHNKTGDIELTGMVTAVGQEFSLTTENLFWDNTKKVLSTAAAVRVEREDFTLTGQGFEYFSETGQATILKDAHLILRKE